MKRTITSTNCDQMVGNSILRPLVYKVVLFVGLVGWP